MKINEFNYSDEYGGFLIPQYLDVPLPGIINRIKRLFHIGGYERVDVYKQMFADRDNVRFINERP